MTLACVNRGISVPWWERQEEGGFDMTIKARTLRLPVDQAEALDAIAGVDEVSINEEIRLAIAAHIEARRQDPAFRERLQASIARNKEVLDRLAR